MKRNKSVDFLTTVIFVGILLSLLLYVGIGTLFWTDSEDSTDEGRSTFLFNDVFYGDDALGYFVKYADYKLFHRIDDKTIIVGEEDWLFETRREQNGYDYLLDYVGGCVYTEEEMAAIREVLENRQRLCEERDAAYLLVVIPNAMTVCQEYLPGYLGEQSENARLSALSAYLAEQGVYSFVNLTDTMEVWSSEGDLYNNTEDSINAYGAYGVYDGILTELALRGYDTESNRLSFEEIEFFTRYTEGKEIARQIGLERVIQNRTVSLTESLSRQYGTVDVTEHCVSTVLPQTGTGNHSRLVIELSEEWDKIQLMPYFSNTFETVVYENAVTDGIEALDDHEGDVLIQIIHEWDLDLLLPKESD